MIPTQITIKLEGIHVILNKILKDYPILKSELMEGREALAGFVEVLESHSLKSSSAGEIVEYFKPALKILELRSADEYSIKEVVEVAESYFRNGIHLLDDLLKDWTIDEPY